MALDKYERGNTIKTYVDFKMSGNLYDPSGNLAWIHVLKSDATYLISGESGIRDSVGEYHYFFESADDDPLGIYIVEWYGYHDLGGSFGAKKLKQRNQIEIVDTSG